MYQLRRLLPASQLICTGVTWWTCWWSGCSIFGGVAGRRMPPCPALLAYRPLHHLFEGCNFQDTESCPHILMSVVQQWLVDSVLKQLTSPLSSHSWCAGPILLLTRNFVVMSCKLSCESLRQSSAKSKSVSLSCFHLMPYTRLVMMMMRNKNGESAQPSTLRCFCHDVKHRGISVWHPDATSDILIHNALKMRMHFPRILCNFATSHRDSRWTCQMLSNNQWNLQRKASETRF